MWKQQMINSEVARLKKVNLGSNAIVNDLIEKYDSVPLNSGSTLDELIRRPELDYQKLKSLDPDYKNLPEDVVEQINIELKYEGYITRQQKQVENFRRVECRKIPAELDYYDIKGLRREAQQKLNMFKPLSIGQASRVSGVTPADISVLLIYLSQHKM